MREEPGAKLHWLNPQQRREEPGLKLSRDTIQTMDREEHGSKLSSGYLNLTKHGSVRFAESPG